MDKKVGNGRKGEKGRRWEERRRILNHPLGNPVHVVCQVVRYVLSSAQLFSCFS